MELTAGILKLSALALVFAVSLAVPAAAAPELNITVNETVVNPGDTIRAAVYVIPNGSSVYGMNFDVAFNPNHLSTSDDNIVDDAATWGSRGADYYAFSPEGHDLDAGIIRRTFSMLGEKTIDVPSIVLSIEFSVVHAADVPSDRNINTSIALSNVNVSNNVPAMISGVAWSSPPAIEILTPPVFIAEPRVAFPNGANDTAGMLYENGRYKFHSGKNITVYSHISDSDAGFAVEIDDATFTKSFSAPAASTAYSGIIAYKKFGESTASKKDYTVTFRAKDKSARNSKGERAKTLSFRQLADGDVNEDNRVDILDLTKIGLSWTKKSGESGYNPLADLASGGDGNIDISDAASVAYKWS